MFTPGLGKAITSVNCFDPCSVGALQEFKILLHQTQITKEGLAIGERLVVVGYDRSEARIALQLRGSKREALTHGRFVQSPAQRRAVKTRPTGAEREAMVFRAKQHTVGLGVGIDPQDRVGKYLGESPGD